MAPGAAVEGRGGVRKRIQRARFTVANKFNSAYQCMLFSYQSTFPKIDPTVFIAPGAVVLGHVTIGRESSIWFNCVLRGDIDRIEIGARSNIQDGAVLHMDSGLPCLIGNDVTIGHGAIVHGCIIEDGAMISMGAVVLSGAKIGRDAIVGSGAVVCEGQEVPPESLNVGVPARIKRQVSKEELDRTRRGKDAYVARAKLMQAEFANVRD